jgi:mono/diheme cytochrome c family protein
MNRENIKTQIVCSTVIALAMACSTNGGKIASSEINTVQVKQQNDITWPASFGLGRPATSEEIALLDIDVRPDGRGLPAGSGTVATGKLLYAAKCALCHGKTGVEGPQARLVGADTTVRAKTIGNYWPHATTIYDYINRAMPVNAPGSLKSDEVYSLTAYLLYANEIIAQDKVIDAKTLPEIKMPAHDLFVPDDRRGGPEIR